MHIARRIFLKQLSLAGIMSMTGFSLFAREPEVTPYEIGSTHMDAFFDPDGWL